MSRFSSQNANIPNSSGMVSNGISSLQSDINPASILESTFDTLVPAPLTTGVVRAYRAGELTREAVSVNEDTEKFLAATIESAKDGRCPNVKIVLAIYPSENGAYLGRLGLGDAELEVHSDIVGRIEREIGHELRYPSEQPYENKPLPNISLPAGQFTIDTVTDAGYINGSSTSLGTSFNGWYFEKTLVSEILHELWRRIEPR